MSSQFGVASSQANFKQKNNESFKTFSNMPSFKEIIDKKESLLELGKGEKTFLKKLELPEVNPICIERKRNKYS